MTAAVPPLDPRTWPQAIPLLILAGLLAYANSFTKAFILDDMVWILGNPDLADAARYLATAGRPVVSLSILVNYWLGGLNPTGYHAVNLTIHILAGLTLYGLVRRVLLLRRFAGHYDRSAPGLAFAVALLWLVHPLQTQAVTYIIQRAESMMGLFYLFTFYAWVRGATAAKRWWYLLGVISFALSCGCKEVAITLPPLLLIFDRVFLARSWWEILRLRFWPYLALLITWGVSLRPLLVTAFSTGASSGVGFAIASVTPYQYLLTQSEVILHYLWLAFVPVNQTVDYIDWPMAQSLSSVWPAFITVITLLAASIVLLFIRPAAGFIGLWFFAILAPTSSFMPIIDPVFEHRMYLSLAAVALGVVLGLEALVRRIPCPPRLTFGIEVSLLSIATLSLLVLTYQRNETYRSLQAALEDNISRRPGNPRPMSSLAAVLLNANDPERAGEWIERGLHIPGPVAPLLYRQKAYWLAMVGRFDEAEQVYRYLVRIDYNFYASPPDYRNAAWFLIGRGKAQEAAELMRALIAHQPQVADNHFILATAELALGRESAAREAAGTAQRLDPSTAARAGAVARALVFAKESAATPILKPRAMWQAAAACLADGDQDPLLLDTLAMAYAWNHEFTQAAAAARRGITAAEKRGERDWAIALRARLKLYETGKAYTKAD